MAPRGQVNTAANVWTARIIPLILSGIVAYASFVLVGPLCVQYLLHKHDDKNAAIPILIIYFVLLLFMAITYVRLVYITVLDPPYVELGEGARQMKKPRRHNLGVSKEDGIGGAEYDTGNHPGNTRQDSSEKDVPEPPGLELFYTKDIFTCEMDGKPRWCSECMNWKPDRAHHCRSSGRCIKKMDHFCPWVGGPVGENNFKFFIQFVFYTAIYCLHLLVVMSIYVAEQKSREGESVDAQLVVILGLAGFFFLFTGGMWWTSIGLAMDNLTQVEKLGAKTRLESLAILKPSSEVLHKINPTSASFPEYFEITYPLGTGIPPSIHNWQPQQSQPLVKSYIHATGAEGVRNLPLASPTVPQASTFPPNGSAVRDMPPMPESLSAAAFANQHIAPAVPQRLNRPQSKMPDLDTTANSRQSSATEPHTDRDSRATRTFAILKMLEPGDNPWDLGTRIANLETVMGISVWDWFLPFRRSPCCHHEDPESYFMVGPWLDLLRQKYGFLDPSTKPQRGLRLKYKFRSSDNEAVKEKRHFHSQPHPSRISTELRDLNRNGKLVHARPPAP